MLADSAMATEDRRAAWTHNSALPCWSLQRLHTLGDRQVEEPQTRAVRQPLPSNSPKAAILDNPVAFIPTGPSPVSAYPGIQTPGSAATIFARQPHLVVYVLQLNEKSFTYSQA